MLIARVQKARAELPRITTEAAQRAGDTLTQQLSSAAPRGKNPGPPPPGDAPGPLSKSFSALAEWKGPGATLELRTNQPLKLQYVTQGTGIYVGKGVIKPLVKKALFWPGAAHPYRSVKGIKGKDFVKPVTSKGLDAVKAEMQKATQEIQAILGGA
jgi:hypothetical protein